MTTEPMTAEDALARALETLPPIPNEFLLHKTWVESDWLPNAKDYAAAILAALSEDGWSVVPKGEVERLRAAVLHDISRQIRALPKVHGHDVAISDEALSEREAIASFIDEVAG